MGSHAIFQPAHGAAGHEQGSHKLSRRIPCLRVSASRTGVSRSLSQQRTSAAGEWSHSGRQERHGARSIGRWRFRSAESGSPDAGGADVAESAASLSARAIIIRMFGQLRDALVPLMICVLSGDAVLWLFHRVCHRITNEVAISTGMLTRNVLENAWWLSSDPNINTGNPGYQALGVLFFLLIAFPVGMALKSAATALALRTLDARASEGSGVDVAAGEGEEEDPVKVGWVDRIKQAVAELRGHWPGVRAAWKRLFAVEVALTLRMLPLQALSLLLVTLPFTLPRIANLVMSHPIAVLEEADAKQTLERSRQLAEGRRRVVLLPLLAPLVAGKLIEVAAGLLMSASITFFVVRGVAEIPVAFYSALSLLGVVMKVAQEVAPYTVYKQITEAAPAGGAL
ncbi:unnamed protein product [Pedinophyceae sp. YPF-701]|nr:unnamed protein product [Pedinophyceae sp. YPF-701]